MTMGDSQCLLLHADIQVSLMPPKSARAGGPSARAAATLVNPLRPLDDEEAWDLIEEQVLAGPSQLAADRALTAQSESIARSLGSSESSSTSVTSLISVPRPQSSLPELSFGDYLSRLWRWTSGPFPSRHSTPGFAAVLFIDCSIRIRTGVWTGPRVLLSDLLTALTPHGVYKFEHCHFVIFDSYLDAVDYFNRKASAFQLDPLVDLHIVELRSWVGLRDTIVNDL